jgi:GAF domain-containing protein
MTENTFASKTRKDYYTTLHQAAITISSSLELDEALKNIVRGVTEAMGAKASMLRLLDAESGQLTVGAAYGFSAEYLAKGPVNVTYSKLDQEIKKQPGCSAVVISDVRTDPRFQYREEAAREGLVSALCMPLKVHDDEIGVLRVYTGEPTAFSDDDQKFLTVLASLAAQAIENARLYDAMKHSYDGIIGAFLGTSLTI